jgi:hypothetical protein
VRISPGGVASSTQTASAPTPSPIDRIDRRQFRPPPRSLPRAGETICGSFPASREA